MRIRTQLVLCFIALSVVPLVAIVGWSYFSSSRAVKRAMLEEAEESTRDIEGRLQFARTALQTRFAELGENEFADDRVENEVALHLGDLAPSLASIMVIPPAPPVDPVGGVQRVAPVPQTAPTPPVPAPIDVDALVESIDGARPHLDATASDPADLARMRGLPPSVVKSIEEARRNAMSVIVAQEQAVEVARRIASAHEEAARSQARLILGDELRHTLPDGREIVATVHPEQFLRRVLVTTGRSRSQDVPFAIDREGNLYTSDDSARERIGRLDLAHPGGDPLHTRVDDDWVIATSRDADTGLTYGIARPVRESLAGLKKTAGTNLGAGLGVIGLALLIILPIANHLTRDLEDVTAGARRIAAGEAGTEVPVRSRNEVGELALAFNRMSHEIAEQQNRILEQEALRREQEIGQRLLEADHERKTLELEDARRFQLSLLPRTLPAHEHLDIAVHMQTATEVGGDYYDAVTSGDEVVIAIGDATGHGARAGTMVTVVKSLFAAHGEQLRPAAFLEEADRAIRRMDLGRMAMALAVARISADRVVLASAGMPPLLLRRTGSGIEEHLLPGTPLGTLGGTRRETSIEIGAGDTLLFMSDGFAETTSPEGEPLGYTEVTREFESATAHVQSASDVIAGLAAAVARRLRGSAPADDITFMVVRRT